jgi:hypothetical protein
MKPGVAIALIIGGVALICLPPLMDYLHQVNAVRVLESASKSTSVSLEGKLNPQYRVGSFLVGSLMIAAAIFKRPAP